MIAIKGMEKIPETCSDCDLCRGHICKITGTDIIANPKGNCPLVEIVTCKDCDYCRFELVEGIPYYWCDKDNCATSENFYCANGERSE
jgi:hypothetical protein